MDAYTGFAEVYDLFMDNVPYDEWADRLTRDFAAQGIEEGLVCELGCGTGQMTRRLADRGFDMIGIDASEEMLAAAQEAEEIPGTVREAEEAAAGGESRTSPGGKPDGAAARLPILYLQQDIREFELYGTVRAAFSVCGTLNYITSPEDLLTVFRLVNNYLDPGGVFVFDIHTPAYYEEIGDTTIAETRDEAAFIWENEYDPGTREDIYEMTFFIHAGTAAACKAAAADGDAEHSADIRTSVPDTALYRRIEETHVQRGWTEEEVRRILKKSGLIFISAEDADTGEPVDEETQTLWIAARESGK